MSDTSKDLLKDTSSADLPLSVLLFYTAMRQDVALSEFARDLGIGALSLRQFISGQAQRPRGRTLELLGQALNMSVNEVRERIAMRPTNAPRFSDWLKQKMDEKRLSRARLSRETQISDGALRNYIDGQTLPDTDQSRRLAETLDVDQLALARVLVADHVVRNGGQTIPADGMVDDDSEDYLDGDSELSSMGGYGRASFANEEQHVIALWRKLHPQARRATLIYIAGLLAEE